MKANLPRIPHHMLLSPQARGWTQIAGVLVDACLQCGLPCPPPPRLLCDACALRKVRVLLLGLCEDIEYTLNGGGACSFPCRIGLDLEPDGSCRCGCKGKQHGTGAEAWAGVCRVRERVREMGA